MTDQKMCPCNSGSSYFDCCEPYLNGGEVAATAESLMRSRYTAYVICNVGYLLKTWHPSTRPQAIDPATIPEWYGLHIIATEDGAEGDDQGIVEFKATSLSVKKTWRLHEVSRFVKEEGQWFYVNGDVKGDTPVVTRSLKVARNEPCPCGSGKKFKKCCGP